MKVTDVPATHSHANTVEPHYYVRTPFNHPY